MASRNKLVLVAGIAALLAAPVSFAGLTPFSQNFEALTLASPTALSGIGFLIAGNDFDGNTAGFPPYGTFKFFYGNFAAPNGGPAFSSIATGEGGIPQGLQYLNVYSDYNCCAPATINGHGDITAPFDYVQSSVFQEQIIALADIGPTTSWILSFDSKLPSSSGCDTTVSSDCKAFIRLIDPITFATTYAAEFNAKTQSNATWTHVDLVVNVSDPLLAGVILQFGFLSDSRQFGNTGVYYDNISFAKDSDTDGFVDTADNCPVTFNPTQVDSDGDGRGDACDNCRLVSNANQLDANLDGYGNICDADINNSGTVTSADFGLMRSVLGQAIGASATAAASDMNGSGTVTSADFGLLRARLGTVVGPSGWACAGTIPCPPP